MRASVLSLPSSATLRGPFREEYEYPLTGVFPTHSAQLVDSGHRNQTLTSRFRSPGGT